MNIDRESFNKAISNKFINKLDKNLYFDKVEDKGIFRDGVYSSLAENTYFPGLPQDLLSCDKGGGVMRFVPVLSRKDAVVYSFCVSSIDEALASNRVEGTYGGWLMSPAMRRKENSENKGTYIAEAGGELSPCSNTFNRNAYITQYGEFNIRIKDIINRCGKGLSVVTLDIANFYDSIRLDLLEDNVRGVVPGVDREVVNCLFFFLRNWDRQINSFGPQSVGIPQEYFGDCSRILANFYLQPYDQKMREYAMLLGGEYLRFADDQVLFVPKKNAKEIVAVASKWLMPLGLNINKSKVMFFDNCGLFAEYRGLSILDTIDVGLGIAKQSPRVVNSIAGEFIRADRRHLAKNGQSIMKNVIHMGLSKLSNDLREEIFRLLCSEYLDMEFDCRLMKEMAEALPENWYYEFLERYSDVVREEIQSYRRFNLLKNKFALDTGAFDWLRPDGVVSSVLR